MLKRRKVWDTAHLVCYHHTLLGHQITETWNIEILDPLPSKMYPLCVVVSQDMIIRNWLYSFIFRLFCDLYAQYGIEWISDHVVSFWVHMSPKCSPMFSVSFFELVLLLLHYFFAIICRFLWHSIKSNSNRKRLMIKYQILSTIVNLLPFYSKYICSTYTYTHTHTHILYII